MVEFQAGSSRLRMRWLTVSPGYPVVRLSIADLRPVFCAVCGVRFIAVSLSRLPLAVSRTAEFSMVGSISV